MNTLLYRWLYLLGFLHIIAGLAVSFFIHFDLDNSYVSYLNSILQNVGALAPVSTDNINPVIPVLLKLFGPVISAWGILFSTLIYCLSNANFNIRIFTSVKLAAIAAVVFWYGLDTLIALQVDLTLHLGFNVAVVVLIALPLMMIKSKSV